MTIKGEENELADLSVFLFAFNWFRRSTFGDVFYLLASCLMDTLTDRLNVIEVMTGLQVIHTYLLEIH